MSQPSRSSVEARYQKFVAGIAKHMQGVQVLAVAGRSFTLAQITALFQSVVDQAALEADLAAKLVNARTVLRDLASTNAAVATGFQQAVRNQFGTQADVLADFGLAPPKARVTTLETKVTAAVKGKATRQARHTLGTKQKAAIKGAAQATPATPPTPKA